MHQVSTITEYHRKPEKPSINLESSVLIKKKRNLEWSECPPVLGEPAMPPKQGVLVTFCAAILLLHYLP